MSAAKRNAVVAALALYLVWALATWFLEGRIETLLRPEAIADRLNLLRDTQRDRGFKNDPKKASGLLREIIDGSTQ